MTFLEELYQDRLDLSRVLQRHKGLRQVVEEMYPDRGHFIYELLQNAEDTRASSVRFELKKGQLQFRHNGRTFTDPDVAAITDFGESSKKDDEDKIGRFGIGFKAVFAYSNTPRIWSPTHSFKIEQLVLPVAIPARPELGSDTLFEFPFDNPKKPPEEALSDIQHGLEDLSEITLLFLTHLQKIEWSVGGQGSGSLQRIRHGDHHIEIRKQVSGHAVSSEHYLKFEEPVEHLPQRTLALAFELAPQNPEKPFDRAKPVAKQFNFRPEVTGQVAIYFPADKETSNLRFHVHAPFVAALDRSSVKDTPANEPLFQQLGSLAAQSLHHIRDLGLLDTRFLEILPHTREQLPEAYHPIREAIIEEMQVKSLTPTYLEGHAPAIHLLQGPQSLKELLTEEDLAFLKPELGDQAAWAVGVNQRRSRADYFLESLEVKRWAISDFVGLLKYLSTSSGDDEDDRGPEDYLAWLAGKDAAWFQELYVLLNTDYLSGIRRGMTVDSLKNIQFVLLQDGKFSTGPECFFPLENTLDETDAPEVDPATYTSGKEPGAQKSAREFLSAIGVRELGEAERIELVLKARYSDEPFAPDHADLERFVDFLERHPERADLFREYYILETDEEGIWGQPSEIYLAKPFMDTGLEILHAGSGNRSPLSGKYLDAGIPPERLLNFLEVVGVQTKLDIVKANCRDNPDAGELVHNARGGRSERYFIDDDFTIHGLEALLQRPSLELAHLIWRTLTDANPKYLTARYRNNSDHPINTAPSQLVHILRNRKWIPQGEGKFEKPSRARAELLPEHFDFQTGALWLQTLNFGQRSSSLIEDKAVEQRLIADLGLENANGLEAVMEFASLPTEIRAEWLAKIRAKQLSELPTRTSQNPERRRKKVIEAVTKAPQKTFEERNRSVAVDKGGIRQEAREFLKEQYLHDREMICQLCHAPMPFRLSDGSHYFEAVEFAEDATQRVRENYLALCPNHAAMFRFANQSRGQLRQEMMELEDKFLSVQLAGEPLKVYFTDVHREDLKVALANLSFD
ncbi:hypothetical protein D3875_04500 [Deinococcus cavernae]|uniref:Sacsin/Nov domain-containing protein n=1 Tax=Deinococcus cavernae TaxID=2320857 RepID=A0A418VER7_9DEIO|nr:hypothetical protein [Deinococcus cavernae]RJF74543.1 hypothetical protein D3875_04500 [Deinococcus cavernae]